jgi:hypothetical protein
MIAKANAGRSLSSFTILQTSIWHTWSFAKQSSPLAQIAAPQEKWSNTTHTQAYQPSPQTSFTNFILAGSHTHISADLWSMEGAAESGRKAALLLDSKRKHAHFIVHKPPLFFRVCAKLDNLLYALRLPNLVDLVIGLGLSVFVLLTLRLILQFLYTDSGNH